MREAIKQWCPSTVARSTSAATTPRVTVEGIGQVTLSRIKAEDGSPTMIADHR